MFNNDSVSIKNLIFDVISEYGQILDINCLGCSVQFYEWLKQDKSELILTKGLGEVLRKFF